MTKRLKNLLNLFRGVLSEYRTNDSKSTRVRLFNVTHRVSIHLLKEEHKITGQKNINLSFTLATDIVERILNEGVARIYENPYTYFSMKAREVLAQAPDEVPLEFLEDLDSFIDGKSGENADLNLEIFCEIRDLLELFFTNRQIKKYLPLAITVINARNYGKIANLSDVDFKYFCILLISLGKKLSRYYVKDVSNGNYNNFQPNDITLILASMKNLIPSEFGVMTTQGLKDLVEVAGGRYIRVPTQSELDEVFNSLLQSTTARAIESKTSYFESDKSSLKELGEDLVFKWLEKNGKTLSGEKLDKLREILGQ